MTIAIEERNDAALVLLLVEAGADLSANDEVRIKHLTHSYRGSSIGPTNKVLPIRSEVS